MPSIGSGCAMIMKLVSFVKKKLPLGRQKSQPGHPPGGVRFLLKIMLKIVDGPVPSVLFADRSLEPF